MEKNTTTHTPQGAEGARVQTEEKPTFTPWSTILDSRGVHVPYKPELMELRDRGFGDLKGDKLHFAPYESFYLLEKQKIKVYNKPAGRELELRDLVRKFSTGKPEIWIKYLVYRDLRDRGYIVRESRRSFDFDIYGKGPLRRLISIIYEGGEASLRKLSTLLNYSEKEKKELILAVVDRRTDIVYYTLSSLRV